MRATFANYPKKNTASKVKRRNHIIEVISAMTNLIVEMNKVKYNRQHNIGQESLSGSFNPENIIPKGERVININKS